MIWQRCHNCERTLLAMESSIRLPWICPACVEKGAKLRQPIVASILGPSSEVTFDVTDLAASMLVDAMDGIPDYQPSAIVVLFCDSSRMLADQVEFVDIHEGFRGEDIMTFRCPRCGENHQSPIYG